MTWKSGYGFPCHPWPVVCLLLCSPHVAWLRSLPGAGAGATPRCAQLTLCPWALGWRQGWTFYFVAGFLLAKSSFRVPGSSRRGYTWKEALLAMGPRGRVLVLCWEHIHPFFLLWHQSTGRVEPEMGRVSSMPGPWVTWARTRTSVDTMIHNVPRASMTSGRYQPSHPVSTETQVLLKVSRCFLKPQIHCLHK